MSGGLSIIVAELAIVAQTAQADGYLSKPFSARGLGAVVQHTLEQEPK